MDYGNYNLGFNGNFNSSPGGWWDTISKGWNTMFNPNAPAQPSIDQAINELRAADSYNSLNTWDPTRFDNQLSGIPTVNGQLPAASNQDGGWFTTLFGGRDANGFQTSGVVSPAVSAFSSGMQAYLGAQNLKLAKKSLAFQKDAFSKQFENQRRLINTQLEDRQRARVSANPGAYQSVDEYMKQHGV